MRGRSERSGGGRRVTTRSFKVTKTANIFYLGKWFNCFLHVNIVTFNVLYNFLQFWQLLFYNCHNVNNKNKTKNYNNSRSWRSTSFSHKRCRPQHKRPRPQAAASIPTPNLYRSGTCFSVRQLSRAGTPPSYNGHGWRACMQFGTALCCPTRELGTLNNPPLSPSGLLVGAL